MAYREEIYVDIVDPLPTTAFIKNIWFNQTTGKLFAWSVTDSEYKSVVNEITAIDGIPIGSITPSTGRFTSLESTGILTVAGDSSLEDALLSGTLTVVGISSLKNTTVDGVLNVTGNSNLEDISATGTLTVAGNSSLEDVSMTGNLQVDGSTTLGNAPADVTNIRSQLTLTGQAGLAQQAIVSQGAGLLPIWDYVKDFSIIRSATAPTVRDNALPLQEGDTWINTMTNTISVWDVGTLSWNLTGTNVPTGAGNDKIFFENEQAITQDYTISAGKNAVTAGPIIINPGVTVAVPLGAGWSVV